MSTRYIQRNEEELLAKRVGAGIPSCTSVQRELFPASVAYGSLMPRKPDSIRFSATIRALHSNKTILLLALLIVSCVCCSPADKRKWKYYSREQNLSIALDSANGDLRREAVARIGQSGYYASADAFHVLDAVARTDPVAQVRCVAIRILSKYNDERPVKTLMTVLTAAGPDGGAVVPTDDVRWEAADALVAMQAKGFLTEDEQAAACEMYIQFMRGDSNRNVRITATRALGLFKDHRVFKPLFDALRNKDFMIADNAEQSLMALTGTTHDYDAEAWAKWLAQTADPFANAGKPVATSRPASDTTWWDEQQRLWRRAIKLGE